MSPRNGLLLASKGFLPRRCAGYLHCLQLAWRLGSTLMTSCLHRGPHPHCQKIMAEYLKRQPLPARRWRCHLLLRMASRFVRYHSGHPHLPSTTTSLKVKVLLRLPFLKGLRTCLSARQSALMARTGWTKMPPDAGLHPPIRGDQHKMHQERKSRIIPRVIPRIPPQDTSSS